MFLGCSEFDDDDDDSAVRSVCGPICHCLIVSTVVLFFELLGSFALCLRRLRLVYNLLLCVVFDSVVVVNSVFNVSVCNRLSSVVVGCRLFRLCHAISAFFKLSRLFESSHSPSTVFVLVIRQSDWQCPRWNRSRGRLLIHGQSA